MLNLEEEEEEVKASANVERKGACNARRRLSEIARIVARNSARSTVCRRRTDAISWKSAAKPPRLQIRSAWIRRRWVRLWMWGTRYFDSFDFWLIWPNDRLTDWPINKLIFLLFFFCCNSCIHWQMVREFWRCFENSGDISPINFPVENLIRARFHFHVRQYMIA